MEIGDYTEKECAVCGVASMRYDGRSLTKEDAHNFEANFAEKMLKYGSYTCMGCKGTYNFQDRD